MSLRIAPSSALPSSTSNTTASKLAPSDQSKNLERGAPSAPGLHDTLRASLQSPSSSSQPVTSTHPLEARLAQWTATQESTRHALLRRTYGIAEPLRRGMELKMVRDADSFRPSVLGAPARVHDAILSGRDTEMTWEDVYDGQDGLRLVGGGDGQGVGFTEEMERMVGMGKW